MMKKYIYLVFYLFIYLFIYWNSQFVHFGHLVEFFNSYISMLVATPSGVPMYLVANIWQKSKISTFQHFQNSFFCFLIIIQSSEK